MLRQRQKSYTVRGHHRRTGLQEHGAGCPQVLAVRTKLPSCLAEVGKVISWRGILGRVEGFTRDRGVPDFHLPPGSFRVGDLLWG